MRAEEETSLPIYIERFNGSYGNIFVLCKAFGITAETIYDFWFVKTYIKWGHRDRTQKKIWVYIKQDRVSNFIFYILLLKYPDAAAFLNPLIKTQMGGCRLTKW